MPKLGDVYVRALVTGASSGLGLAFSKALIAEGVEVWGTSRNPDSVFDSSKMHPVKLDLLVEEDVREWFNNLDEAVGGFDLVINNAGFAVLGEAASLTSSQVDTQLRVLLEAPLHIGIAAVQGMRLREKGCLVNVSSVAADMWIPCLSVYNTAKAGLSAFSQSLMLEAPDGAPWVIDFKPGDYQTSFNKSMQKTVRDNSPGSIHMWAELEAQMADAPSVSNAANDLVTSLRKFRHVTGYSGTFVQSKVATVLGRLLPNVFKRKLLRRYYHLQ